LWPVSDRHPTDRGLLEKRAAITPAASRPKNVFGKTEVAVCVMLEAMIRKPIQTRQTANACVRVIQRYRASHEIRDDLLDPLWANIVADNENALQVRRSKALPGWQLLPGRGS
jgi:hypothetical protein